MIEKEIATSMQKQIQVLDSIVSFKAKLISDLVAIDSTKTIRIKVLQNEVTSLQSQVIHLQGRTYNLTVYSILISCLFLLTLIL